MDGTWTHSRGTRALRPCVPIFCPKLPIIPFADVVAVDNAPRAVHLVGVQVKLQKARMCDACDYKERTVYIWKYLLVNFE